MKDSIEYHKGNLLDVKSGIIIHGVNAQGVMGSGVALAVKQRFPEAYQRYMLDYNDGSLRLGTSSYQRVSDNLYIANACTQEYYGRDGQRYVNYMAICSCFYKIFQWARTQGYACHFPKLGAGLGGGSWEVIQQLINDCDPENKVRKICWELE